MLLCFTASHHTTAFAVLERLEQAGAAVTDALADSPVLRGSVVLATCNRFEVYADVADHAIAPADAAAHLCDLVAAGTGLTPADVDMAGRMLHGTDVAEHAFAVASGLESVVVGEGEIAGQVRRALEQARARGGAGRELDRLFQRASRLSRGVRTQTHLSSVGRSVVRLALDLAEARVTDWAGARVLLVGTGRYAGASLAALRECGVTHVRVHSQSGRAATFAEGHGIDAVPADGLVDALADSDVVIACTLAESVVVDAGTVAAAAARTGGVSRRLIIDLGLPRNVDPGVAAVAGTDLLDLETIGAHAGMPEVEATAEARGLVEEALADYRDATAEDAAVPALVALRSHVFRVLDDEIASSARRGHDDPEIAAALRHFAGVLLHTPSVRARELARDGHADQFSDAVEALFAVTTARTCLWSAEPNPGDPRTTP